MKMYRGLKLNENVVPKIENYSEQPFDGLELLDVQIIKEEFKNLFIDGIKNKSLSAGTAIPLIRELKENVDTKTKMIPHYSIDVQGNLTENITVGYYLVLFIREYPVMALIHSMPTLGGINTKYKQSLQY